MPCFRWARSALSVMTKTDHNLKLSSHMGDLGLQVSTLARELDRAWKRFTWQLAGVSKSAELFPGRPAVSRHEASSPWEVTDDDEQKIAWVHEATLNLGSKLLEVQTLIAAV